MEIKLNNQKVNILFYIVFIFSIQITSDPVQLLTDNSGSKLMTIDTNKKNPLNGIIFDLTKIVNSSNKIIYSAELNKMNEEITQPLNDNELILSSGEYIQIRGVDNIPLLFNGSILIRFEELPNLNDFAITNNIEFEADLSDINMGIFKINNLIEIQSKIDSFKNDTNILSIELSTINPAQVPQ